MFKKLILASIIAVSFNSNAVEFIKNYHTVMVIL